MKDDHYEALLRLAEAKRNEDGWHALPQDRVGTLYVAFNGVSLTVGRVQALRREGSLVYARTAKGESYVLALEDIQAGAVDAPQASSRKAGFQTPG